MERKVVVIGGGSAGYAAAIYLGRAEMQPLVLVGPDPGGQLVSTTEVENYPGFSKGVQGPQLMQEMSIQAERFGAEIRYETATEVDFSRRPFRIKTDGGEYMAGSVILAVGAHATMLNIGEEKFLGKGLSTCAVCDAAFYKGKRVYVVGGGDVAVEDAWALTKFASEVTMLVRRDKLRASKAMQKRLIDNPEKIRVLWNTVVKDIKGNGKLESIVVTKEGEEQTLPADGLFLAIGHMPATGFLKGTSVMLDEKGYVVIGLGLSEAGVNLAKRRLTAGVVDYPTMTSVEGVFAAGDAVDFYYRQAVIAAGTGVMAALDAERFMESGDSR